MKDQSQASTDYEIVIIECCQNCETHQNFARHSQWKYFQQFNQLKRKIEKFINNTVVIKNPVPDELIKNEQIMKEKNLFVNKDTRQKIIFPRIGSFEIYIYNVLISSKLMTNQWPNHYKILQVIAKIIEDKKKGNSLDQYSVFNQTPLEGEVPKAAEQQKKNLRIVSKKKKANSQLANKAYKSIEKSQRSKDPKSTLEPISAKLIDLQSSARKRFMNRYLQSKAQARVKLPSLNNSLNNSFNIREEASSSKEKESRLEVQRQNSATTNKINRQISQITEGQKVSILELRQESRQESNNNKSYLDYHQQRESQTLKFLENRSVQFSQQDPKDLMNRSIQYEQQQGFYCDFGLQVDNKDIFKKELTYNYVQTDKIEVIDEPKPYMLDQMVQANIIIKKKQAQEQTQTIIKNYIDSNVSTDVVAVVNRGFQYPQEVVKAITDAESIDSNFRHLYEKRRNIVDSQYYSIDRFQEKSTKYKWIGRANLAQNMEELKKKIFLQCLVFSVYNYFGIKTPERRLSYQLCCNVVGQKMKESALHVMTSQNPEIQYMSQFEQWNFQTEKYPLAELITFKNSKQQIKFHNYGGLLALAYFMNDFQVFNGASTSQIGLVVVNQAVKQIHKLSSLNYVMHPTHKNGEDQIFVSLNNNSIKLNRLSQAVELQFFSMLARIADPQTFSELLKYLSEIFIHMSSTYQQFRSTILSLTLEKTYETQTVEDFILMLQNRMRKIQEYFKGKLYTYKKYHTLTPNIKYALPFQNKLERKLICKEKSVNLNDLIRHVRNKDNLLIIEGEDGLGKSTLISDLSKQLKQNEKLNVVEFSQLRKERNRMKDDLFQLVKNIIFIDNAQLYQSEALAIIDRYSKGNFQVSFCVCTSNSKHGDMFKNRYPHLTIIQSKLLPFDSQDIRNYLTKGIKNQSFTAKKDLIQKLLQNQRYTKILGNPFYLSLYSNFLSRIDCEKYIISEKDLTKYMIMKEHFSYCTTLHMQEMKEMDIGIKEVLPNLRRLAFEYYHNDMQMNETLRDILSYYQQSEIIRSQIVYYPLNLQSLISTSYQPLFCHNLFFNYFLVEAYSYFVEKGYRNMHMEKLFNNSFLMSLIRERYALEETHSQLVQIALSSKKFKNITEASSNAITLLSKMEFVFSNMNFDDCNISQADLSNSIFYQCSFRGADLEKAVLYKSQMISCIFDNALMNKINLYSKKYEIEFTAMATSLSVDGRKIAFGCGNYLIIINAQTGSEIKRIQAHLDVIRIVKYTKDGNSLITVADDKTLRIWDVYTYKSVVFKLPQKGSISYSNETETIASVNKNSLKVWNLKSMANQAELQGHTEAITTVEFSYDGQSILTGSKDTTLRLWTLRGQQRIVFKGHDSQILVGKLSPVRRTMVSSSKNKDIILWQVETGNKILSKKFTNEITEICLDNKEKYVIVTYSNDSQLVILDFITFDIVHVLSGHQAKIMSISFDHSFRQLISLGKDRTARVWQFDKIMETEARIPKLAKKVHKGPILALVYDKVRRKYATSHQNGEINIWSADDNALIDQVFSHNGTVKCLAYDNSGRIYAGGSDGTLRIWNLQARRQPRVLEIHSSEMLQLKLSEKNRIFVTSSVANELVVYDFTGIKIIMSTREEGRVNAIAFSHDERIMAVGGAEKYVVLYEVTNSNSIVRTDQLGSHSDAVTSLCFFGDTLLVVALKNGHVAIWNHQKVNMIKKIENLSPIKDIISFQKKYICFTSQDGKARIVNMDEGRQIKVFRYSELPLTIDTNQNETLLYVGSSQGNVLVWNLNCVKPTGKRIQFDRKAIDVNCTKIVTVESGKSLLIKDLFSHKEEIVQVKVDSDIEGVTFDEDRIVLLLKNGKYWQFGKKQYKFNSNRRYQGDLFYIRDKTFTNFFKSGLKKIKGMNKPALAVLEEISA